MANIKSAQKRIKITETKTLRNRVIKSALKTSIKKFELSLDSDNAEETKNSYLSVVKALDMAASKGVIHKNMAARKKSRLNARMNKISA